MDIKIMTKFIWYTMDLIMAVKKLSKLEVKSVPLRALALITRIKIVE